MSEPTWIGEPTSSRGVVERRFDVAAGGRTVPALLWTPENATGPKPLVLIGHGGSLHKRSDYVLGLARRLVRHRGFAAAAIDGPVHGDRKPEREEDVARAWERDEATDEMVEDWAAALDALATVPEVGDARVGYWGLSMGTIFGLPFVAAEPRVQVAVFGLWGRQGPTASRLSADAKRVRCPVLFLQQWHDELVPRERAAALFDAIASRDKRLHANPGAHAAVPADEFGATEAFLARHLGASEEAA